MGREIPSRESLYCFIGPPLVPAFQSFLGMSEDEAKTALSLYREYFSENGLFENKPYDSIHTALGMIKNSGIRMAVATSKPEIFAKRIVSKFELDPFFERVFGASLDESRTEKADVISYAIRELGAKAEECIMVGDRHHDVEGALKNGIPALGVLWGFGSAEELSGAGASGLFDTPIKLAEHLTDDLH